MSRLQDLRARLMLDNAQFGRGLRDARQQAQGFAGALRSIIAPVAATLASGLSFAAVAAGARKGADEIDAAAKSARALQGSVGGVRAVEMALGEAGVAAGVVREQFQNMDRQIASGRAEAAMRALGLEARDLASMDVDQKVATIADRIKDLGLDTGATMALLRQFGVENKSVAVAVMQGGDAIRSARRDVEDYGLALGAMDTAKIEAANDQLGRLSVIGQYFRQELALQVVPALGAFAERMTESMRTGGALRAVIDGLVSVVANFKIILQGAGVALAAYAASQAPAFIAALAAQAASITALRGGLSLMTAQMYAGAGASAALGTAMRGLAGVVAMAGGPFGILAALLGGSVAAMILFRDTSSTAKPIVDQARDAIDQLNSVLGTSAGSALPAAARETLNLTNENIRLAKSAYEAAAAEVAKANAAAQYAQTEIDLQRAFSPTGRFDQAESDLARAMQRLTETNANLRAAQVELQNRINEGQLQLSRAAGETVSKLTDVKVALGDVALTGGAGLSGLRQQITALPQEMTPVDVAAQRIESSFESAFVNAITNIKNARQALAGLLNDLAKMLAQAAFRRLFGGSGIFGGIASAFGIGANANGTNNWRGGLTWVGERGKELVNLPKGSQVFDAQKSAMMTRDSGGGQTAVRIELGEGLVGSILNQAGAQTVQIVQTQTPRIVQSAFMRARERRDFDS